MKKFDLKKYRADQAKYRSQNRSFNQELFGTKPKAVPKISEQSLDEKIKAAGL